MTTKAEERGSPCLSDGELLQALAGELPAAQAVRVEDHLDACDACRTLLVALVRAAPTVFCGGVESEADADAPAAPRNWHKRL